MANRVSLFKVLRRELGSQLTAEGFTEVPQDASSRNHMLFYFREPSRGRSLGFWFQRNVKSLSVDALGSFFSLEFFRSLVDPYNMNNRERAYYLLTPPEREKMRSLQNNMIKRLPPLESIVKPWEIKAFGKWMERERQVINKAFNPLHDVWMRYRDADDILAWTCFIGSILPALAERFDIVKPQSAESTRIKK